MEIKKKLVFFILIILLNSCNIKQNNSIDFYIENNNKIEKTSGKIIHIKENIYSLNNNIYIGLDYFIQKPDYNLDVMKNEFLGIYLINKKSIIDIDTYKSIFKDILYKDKNNFYIISKGRGCIFCLKIINLKYNKIKIIDENYLVLNDNIFCINEGVILPNVKQKYFSVYKNSDGINYGIYKNKIFSNCEEIDIKTFTLKEQKELNKNIKLK